MFMIYEDAVFVLLALGAAALLCMAYVIFLLLSKGVRILAAFGVKAYTRRSFEKEMDNSRVAPDLLTPILGLLAAAAYDIPSDRLEPALFVSSDADPIHSHERF